SIATLTSFRTSTLFTGGLVVFIFFFQAEDGIRDRNVTGVQTCALPIFHFLATSPTRRARKWSSPAPAKCSSRTTTVASASATRRSEERRVGKECRARGAP